MHGMPDGEAPGQGIVPVLRKGRQWEGAEEGKSGTHSTKEWPEVARPKYPKRRPSNYLGLDPLSITPTSFTILTIPKTMKTSSSTVMAHVRAFMRGPRFTWGVLFSFLFTGAAGQSGFAWDEDLCNYTTNYELVFDDDFSGTAVDGSKWVTWLPFSSDGSDQCESCRVSGEVIYMDEQMTVSNGILTIRNTKTPTTWWGQTRDWRSSMLWSRVPFNEGKFEIRCQIPAAQGSIPAFWLYGEGGNEVDVFEFCGTSYQTMKCSIHRTDPQDPPLHDTHDETISSTYQGWHRYGVEWVDDFVIWYFDGTEVHRRCRWDEVSDNDDCTLQGPYTRGNFPADDCHMNVLASMGMSDGGFCGPVSSAPWNTSFDFNIDYIRAWQNNGHLENEVHNLCSDPPPSIVSSTDAFCTVGQEVDFQLVGLHGDPVTWSLEWDGQSEMQIIQSDNDHCRVRCNSLQTLGHSPTLVAHDPENPCDPGSSYSMQLYVSVPWIEPITGNANPIDICPGQPPCPTCNEYWCIEPVVLNNKPIANPPQFPFTTYYPPTDTYNEYDPLNPGTPTPEYLLYSWPRPYQVFVDGEEQSRTFKADYEAEYWGGGTVDGAHCDNAPLTCQEHWTNWGEGGWPFCLMKDGDFCHEVRIVAHNGCGSAEQVYQVRDRCVVGPCDYDTPNPNDPDGLLISIYPTPVTNEFTVRLDPCLTMASVTEIVVEDANLRRWARVVNPTDRTSTITTAGWPQGIYYVKVNFREGYRITKIQIK